MKMAEKCKTIAVKCNPPRYSREYINEMTNIGFKPKYQTSIKGKGRSVKDGVKSDIAYAKGWALMNGLCETCKYFTRNTSRAGKHCKRNRSEHCVE